AAGSKTGTPSSRATASAGESVAVGRFDIGAPRIDGDAGMVGRCRWSRLSWRPAGASALFQRRLQVIGSRCGLEDEGHDAGGDHGRTGRAGSWRAREATPPQKARSSRRADMQTCTIRRLPGGLNGADASSGSGSLRCVHRAEEDDMQPMTELEADRLRRYYRTFARVEAADTSPVYAEWAQGVADDGAIIDLLLDLPQSKRQANLLFAAARHLGSGTGT